MAEPTIPQAPCKWCKQPKGVNQFGECGTCWIMREFIDQNQFAAVRMLAKNPDLPDLSLVLTNTDPTGIVGP